MKYVYTEQAKERQGVNLGRQGGHEFWDKNESLGDKEVPQWTCNFSLVGEEKEQLVRKLLQRSLSSAYRKISIKWPQGRL